MQRTMSETKLQMRMIYIFIWLYEVAMVTLKIKGEMKDKSVFQSIHT